MATLSILYDTDKKTFVNARLGDRPLPGISNVILGRYTISVIDGKGNDLLTSTTDEPVPESEKAQADIAAAFGFTGEVEDQPDRGPRS